MAAIKFSRAMGVDTIIPAGDIDHFRFALEHENDIWDEALSEKERKLLEEHLPSVTDALFMPEEHR